MPFLLCFCAVSVFAAPVQRAIPQTLPGHPGNIFLRGEEITLPRPAAENATGWLCVDYDQKVVAQGKDAIAKLGALPVGYYEIWATDAANKRLAKTTLGVLEPLKAATPLDSPIAVDIATAWFYNPHDGQPSKVKEAANQAALAGVNWVRDRLNWGVMEPQRGQFATGTIYDETAREQAAAGLQVLQVFHSSPKWVNPDGKRMPLDLRDGYNFLKEMSSRWRDQVRAWEPWNEADITGFGGHSGLEMATYQKAAYWGVRAGDPDAIVCQNVFAQPSRTGVLDNFIENEAAAYFDTFNFHHYSAPSSYPSSYETMRTAAAGKPLWVSEAGTHIPWEGDEKAQEPSWENQQKQARFVTECFANSIANGSRATFFFLLPHYVEGRTQFGLTHKDLTPRPAYLALAAAGRFLASAKPLGQITGSGNDAPILAFHAMPDGKPQTVLVALSEDKKIVPQNNAMQIFDFLGRETALNNMNPLYILLPENVKLNLVATPQGGPRRATKPCSVVLQPLPENSRLRLGDSSYRLAAGETYEMPLFAYNFDAQAITTSVAVDVPPQLKIEVPAEPFTLAPMERRELKVRVSLGAAAMPIEPVVARFRANCGAAGQALAAVRFSLPIEAIQPAKILPLTGALDLKNWRKMVSPGEMNLEIQGNDFIVDAKMQPGDRWAYPVFTPPAAEAPNGDWDGVAFTIVPLVGQAEFRAIFDEANGSSYVGDTDFPKPLEMNKPYHAVVLFKRASWGAFSKPDENNQLDPAQIRTFKIGTELCAWTRFFSAFPPAFSPARAAYSGIALLGRAASACNPCITIRPSRAAVEKITSLPHKKPVCRRLRKKRGHIRRAELKRCARRDNAIARRGGVRANDLVAFDAAKGR